MPQSERFEVLSLVQTYDATIGNFLVTVDQDETPKLQTDNAELLRENEKFAKKFFAEMQAAARMTTGLHWRWAQMLFFFDAGKLWATKEAGEYHSFNDWLTDNLPWLPFGRAQANKLKRVWLIYIHYLKCDKDPELLDLLLQIGNIDKLSELAATVTKKNVKEWLMRLVEVNPTLKQVHEIGKVTKRLIYDQGVDRNDITPDTLPTPFIVTPEPTANDDDDDYNTYEDISEPIMGETEERYKTLKSTGIGKSWYGKIPPEAPVSIRRSIYPDKTVITIYRRD